MKKLILSTFLLLILFQHEVSAAPSTDEVSQLLQEIGWTNNDLQRYFNFYDVSLNDYETINDLKEELGTPITDARLNQLFSNYQMTKQDVDALFTQFDDSLANYFFIEDVDASIDFYLNYDENMDEYNEFLSMIGITDEELQNLVDHFTSLDEATLEREMESITSRLESLLDVEDLSQLTEAQQNELLSIWQDMMKAFKLETKFYFIDQAGKRIAVSLSELLNMNDAYGNDLLIELYDDKGTLLLDMMLSDDLLTSDFLMRAGQQLTDVNDFTRGLTNKHPLPKTASPFSFYLISGLLFILLGMFLYSAKSRKVS